MNVFRYYHTLKHLKPVQIYGRLLYCWPRLAPKPSPAPALRVRSGDWVEPAKRRPSLTGENRCVFLDEEHDIGEPSAWNDNVRDRLWLYHLHYFDDLNAESAAARRDWQRSLMERWVGENPPVQGAGWEAYPSARRIVNWIAWALAGQALSQTCRDSLAVQARWLSKRVEYHLLGNHLFVNAKALVFAGVFFQGREASAWLAQGMAILRQQTQEQILPDGGHFERSPMYHALILEDLLDLLNLFAVYAVELPAEANELAGQWAGIVQPMRLWLAGLCHPDGEIGFFNDAAIGMAPSPAELDAYAKRLGLGVATGPAEQCAHFGDSGYIRIRLADNGLALLDVAPIGPDYQPGHAHADSLSFELSLFGQRVLVNSGTSRYGLGPERVWQRSTAAHNTVTINGKDSSEVWAGFRVSRRAKPFGLRVWGDGAALRILCAHDGYQRLRGSPVHWREWQFGESALTVVDHIEGRFQDAVSRLYFFPGLTLAHDPATGLGHADLPNGRRLAWQVEGAVSRLAESAYFPEFGVAEPNQCLEMRLDGSRCAVRLAWA